MENVLKITLKRYNGDNWDKIYLRTSTDMIEVNENMKLSELIEMILSKIDTDGEIISGIISPDRLPKATTIQEGIAKLGATGGSAEFLHDHKWREITDTPDTLAGYGITDGARRNHTHDASDIISGDIAGNRLPFEYTTTMPTNQAEDGYWFEPLSIIE